MDDLASHDTVGLDAVDDAALSFSDSERATVLLAANTLATVVSLAERSDRLLAAPHLRPPRWEGEMLPELSPGAKLIVDACEQLLQALESASVGFSDIEHLNEALSLGVPPHLDPPEFNFLRPLLERVL